MTLTAMHRHLRTGVSQTATRRCLAAATAHHATGSAVHRQQGAALILVLWLLVLLTVVAASHARIVRTETRLASNHVEAGKARSLAEAGAYHAILELMVSDEAQHWPVDGSVMHVMQPDGRLAIAIRDARGLIDINTAQPALLEMVLEALGVADDWRRSLVDATFDWRDRDQLRRLHGAEDDDYVRAGLRWTAGDRAFSSIEEFRYIMGMTNPLFERLAPYLTVFSGHHGVRPEFAPPWLAGLLQDTEQAAARSASAGRRGGNVFHVTVHAASHGGSTASLDMVVRITPSGEEPYRILSWRVPARMTPGVSG